MRTLIMMLPMMFLILGVSACGTTTHKLVCQDVRDNDIKPKRSCDLSFQFNRCRCRCFDFDQWQTKELKECPELDEGAMVFLDTVDEKGKAVRDFPVQYCEGISGFFLEDMASEFRPKVKALNELRKMYCD